MCHILKYGRKTGNLYKVYPRYISRLPGSFLCNSLIRFLSTSFFGWWIWYTLGGYTRRRYTLRFSWVFHFSSLINSWCPFKNIFANFPTPVRYKKKKEVFPTLLSWGKAPLVAQELREYYDLEVLFSKSLH